jgi:two-component sensor histidine kinase
LLVELSEFRDLSRILVDDPLRALRQLLKVVRHLCNAGSASVSLLRYDAEGRGTIVWEVISGALSAYEGRGFLKDSSPCRLCLDAATTIRLSRPARVYEGLRDIQPSIVEGLAVPLYDNAHKPLGTLWMAHHDQAFHFSSDDARILEQFAIQAVLAITLLERSRERRYAANLLEAYHRAQCDLFNHELCRERKRREQVEKCEGDLRHALLLKQSVIEETHHRVKNTLQVAASVLSSHARASGSEEVRTALHKSHACLQLLAKTHELLCAGGEGAQTIPMSTLLDGLSNALQHSFAAMSSRVTLRVVAEPLRLPANEAIAVAMLANEVLTNAYKHAFPNNAHGQITLTMQLAPDDKLTLRIMDNGIGLGEKDRTDGTGLKLVRAFAVQLGGSLSVAAGPDSRGTVFTLTMQLQSTLCRGDAGSSPGIGSGKPS